jgi:hypothetical protein
VRVRKKLNGLRQFGAGQKSLWVNTPDGVGQCIVTRLALWQSQWYLDLPAGTRWLTKIIGKYTGSTRDAEIQARVLGTTGVQEILNYSSSLDRTTRRWNVNLTVKTQFGTITVVGYIPPASTGAGIGFFVIGESAIGVGGLG